MEVEACEDFLYIMFSPLRQILFILYRCQIHNMFSHCAVQKVINATLSPINPCA